MAVLLIFIERFAKVSKFRQLLILFGLILVMSSILWWVFIRIPSDSILVKVIVAPTDAKIKINDQNYSAKDRIVLKKQQVYNIEVSRDGFETINFIKTFNKHSKNNRHQNLAIALDPKTDEAKELANKQELIYRKVEAISGSNGAEFAKEFAKNHPIINHLPIQDGTYKIGYLTESDKNDLVHENSNITITIYADSNSRMAALRKLKDLGLDLKHYEIIFFDLEATEQINPYQQTKELNL